MNAYLQGFLWGKSEHEQALVDPYHKLHITADSLTRPRHPATQQVSRLPLGDGHYVSYIRLHYFSSGATTKLRQLVADAEADSDVAGFILDLRNNPGGCLVGGWWVVGWLM